jgi:ubiquinone/menaquinone biosynthesis C-methylase UbiE
MSESKENLKQNQYANSGNFNARIYLHKTFGTNKYPWPFWVFDQLKQVESARVLELGGGNGLLWMANAQRIPKGWDITISDLSSGMLKDAERNLANAQLSGNVQFEVIDAEQIPYLDHQFDIVIANHMLYHVENRRKALSEIKRVLKPDGTFYASTVGSRNMRELKEWINEYNPNSNYEHVLGDLENQFSLENGKDQLLEVFKKVQLCLYDDSLSVTDSEALVRYVLSLNGVVTDQVILEPEFAENFKGFLDRKMKHYDGKLLINKASGLFKCE